MNGPATRQSRCDPLLTDLTEPQRRAVTHVQGPLLVLAGAGSGKTRVITRRVAHLIQRVGIPPWQVLAITFTNKAATEMQARVAGLMTQRQAESTTVSTFHRFCARLIRMYADRLSLPPGYSIYDRSDQIEAVKQALTALQINPNNFPPGKVLATIGQAKNELVDAEGFAALAGDFYSRTAAGIYRKYQAILVKNNALDFDDLLLRAVQLLRDHPDIKDRLQEQYQYLLIDEYQDTNHAQFILAHAMAGRHQNICATGDPDQSIYSWRGANISNILEFESHYPDATVVRLEQNYRSTKRILAVADTLIRHNTQRKPKSLWTENDDGEPVQVVACYNEQHEAQWVVQRLTQLHTQERVPWGGMAVFYRVNSISRVVEEALRTANIPYQVARGTAFYDRKEIKDSLAYLRMVTNPADEVNLSRVINTPARGISANTVKLLRAHAVTTGVAFDRVMADPVMVGSLNTRAVAAVQRFWRLVQAWRSLAGLDSPEASMSAEGAGDGSLRAFVERVLKESGLQDHYSRDKSDPDQERLMNLGELVSSAQQFEDQYVGERGIDDGEPDRFPGRKLLAFLEQVSLVSDTDAVDAGQGAVTLMTLHAAKGLEYPVVSMVGLEDGLLPHSRSHHSGPEMEEERRLCFVGITRAQQQLFMTHTRYRSVFGRTTPTIPSRFLEEVAGSQDAVSHQDLTDMGGWPADGRSHRYDAVDQAPGDDAPDVDGLASGHLVRHPTFGLGRVLDVGRSGPQSRAKVRFETAGVKTLLLQYAQLEKLGG